MKEEINIKIVTIKCDFLGCGFATRMVDETEYPGTLGNGWQVMQMEMPCYLGNPQLVYTGTVHVCPQHVMQMANAIKEKQEKEEAAKPKVPCMVDGVLKLLPEEEAEKLGKPKEDNHGATPAEENGDA